MGINIWRPQNRAQKGMGKKIGEKNGNTSGNQQEMLLVNTDTEAVESVS